MNGSATYVENGEVYATETVDNGHARLWKRTGQTHNPRVVALADGATYDGWMHTVHLEDGLVLLQHWNAGIQHRFHGTERIVPAAVTWELLDPVFGDDAERGSGGDR